jgi:hypothetical protein
MPPLPPLAGPPLPLGAPNAIMKIGEERKIFGEKVPLM